MHTLIQGLLVIVHLEEISDRIHNVILTRENFESQVTINISIDYYLLIIISAISMGANFVMYMHAVFLAND